MRSDEEKYKHTNERYERIEAFLGLMKCPNGKTPSHCICIKIDDNSKEVPFAYQLDRHTYYNGLKYHRSFDSFEDETLVILVVGYLKSDKTSEIIILTELDNIQISDGSIEFLQNEVHNIPKAKLSINNGRAILDMPFIENSEHYISVEILTGKEKDVLRLYLDKVHNEIFNYVPEDKQLERISEIVRYVEDFDYNAAINSYKVIYSGHFQRRVGRDDHYFYSYNRTIETDDPYVRSLFDLTCVNDYYSCVGQGDDEIEVENELKLGQMQGAIKLAFRQYTKYMHIAYLLRALYKDITAKAALDKQIDLQIKSLYSQIRN